MRQGHALVLFSGGQDSTVCLAWALQRFARVETIGFDYGQRHHVELQARQEVLAALRAGFPHWHDRLGDDHMVDLAVLGQISDTALTRDTAIAMDAAGLPNTFVPGRNLLFFQMAAAVGYRRGLHTLVGGMCETDFSGYPDCRDDTLKALQVLDATYLPELPEDLRRARALLRARALSDLSRTDLALETIEEETGADAVRLRADILWTGRRWREAGEAHEALVGEAWRQRAPLDDTARSDVLRTAIAYGLAGETLGLERLRAKFAGPMSESVDARTFALLTQPNAVRTQGFREIAQKATSAETLQAFLAEYRKRYPDTAVPVPAKRDPAARADAQGAGTPPG